MKRKFFRATHIGGEHRKELDEVSLSSQAGFLIDVLSSRETLSFKDIIQRVEGFKDRKEVMTEREIALALIELIENDFVKLL